MAVLDKDAIFIWACQVFFITILVFFCCGNDGIQLAYCLDLQRLGDENQ